ncbi:hypothetical protein POM88_010043 [Heracleum sosnowskyi]|uniref:Uncharacterized protein n=1 Tax=Heracleum sosnowskyi TaxID=360622 RepID=A0AAD8JCX4_9APIA|nr:hypothetical protein POM88_010043 [Heracleum sosnowskyi]
MSDIFAALVILHNPEIKTSYSDSFKGSIVVSAPNIRNFTFVGVLTITFGASKLDTVNIKLKGWINPGYGLPGLILRATGAKIIKLDLATIEGLSLISDFFGNSSPFYNLKYVKLPHGCNESSICTSLRSSGNNTFLNLNHLHIQTHVDFDVDIDNDDAPSQAPVVGPKKKKRGQSAIDGDKSGRGLRQFSMKVCEKVESKGRTTYNEVS